MQFSLGEGPPLLLRQVLAAQDRPDGRAHYYLFRHNVTGLNVSVRIEPAGTCTTAEACRETHWRDGSPHLATAELLNRSERNGFSRLEFNQKFQVPQLGGAEGRATPLLRASRSRWVLGGYPSLDDALYPGRPADVP